MVWLLDPFQLHNDFWIVLLTNPNVVIVIVIVVVVFVGVVAQGTFRLLRDVVRTFIYFTMDTRTNSLFVKLISVM